MPLGNNQFYNFWTRVWYKILRRPIRLRAAYDSRTKDPRLTVVFLHGISATSSTWHTTLNQFTQNPDFDHVRFIALDLLGFGISLQATWLKYDYNEYNRALNAALKHLKVSGPVVIVGHSMGALIAANYVVDFRPNVEIADLILVSPPVLMPDELAKLPDKVYTKSYGSLHRLAKDEPVMEIIANFIQRFSSFSSKYLKTPAFARAMNNIILNDHNYQTFAKLRVPTLIIHGHFDPLVMRSNLKHVAEANAKFVNFVSVMGHHDVSAQKRSKILIELKKVLRETRETKTRTRGANIRMNKERVAR